VHLEKATVLNNAPDDYNFLVSWDSSGRVGQNLASFLVILKMRGVLVLRRDFHSSG
jgi:hypothetical protein